MVKKKVLLIDKCEEGERHEYFSLFVPFFPGSHVEIM